MKDSQFAKLVVFVCSLVPMVLFGLDVARGNMGPDPANYALKVTGISAILFLSLSLAVTPLRTITGKNYWSLFRRMLGLYAFAYACVHLFCYLWFIVKFDLGALVSETVKRPFVYFGMFALLSMVPLAATSTAGAIKRLGAKRWKRLHQLVYLTAIAAALHFFLWQKLKRWDSLPGLFIGVLGGLLAFRLVAALMSWWRKRQKAKLVAVNS